MIDRVLIIAPIWEHLLSLGSHRPFQSDLLIISLSLV